jgi:hypothetical protein
MLASLKMFLRWFRRRAIRTQILVALLIVATFLGCFGFLTPNVGPRGVPAPTPTPRAGSALIYTAL